METTRPIPPAIEGPTRNILDTPTRQKKVRQGASDRATQTPDSLKQPRRTVASRREVTQRQTKIVADIDVGFGNSVYIRGDGAGLSWEKGLPLTCTDHRTWVWTTTSADDHFLFKLLLNDTSWAIGDNVLASPGETVTVSPLFG